MENSRFFQIFPSRIFEPEGEECGTIYDDSTSCPLCGSGAKQLSPLILKRYSIPRADMAMTIADGDEIIVSERFVKIVKEQGLSGMIFLPVYSALKEGHKIKYYQISSRYYMDISPRTVFGINHVDTLRRSGLRFIDDDQTRRDACTEEYITRQTDDA